MATKKNISKAGSVGYNIMMFREKKFPGHGGMAKAAAEFGVSQSAWGKWEAGKSLPDLENQIKLADFFGIEIQELRAHTEDDPWKLLRDVRDFIRLAPNGEWPGTNNLNFPSVELLKAKDEVIALWKDRAEKAEARIAELENKLNRK